MESTEMMHQNRGAREIFRRKMETIGVFKQGSPRVFENTPMSECLRKGVPGSQWAFMQLFAPGWGYSEGLGELVPTLRTGKTTLFETLRN